MASDFETRRKKSIVAEYEKGDPNTFANSVKKKVGEYSDFLTRSKRGSAEASPGPSPSPILETGDYLKKREKDAGLD